MSSERRIRASRANGAKSRGPKTPEGKRRSSMNAMRHGLLAKTVVVDGECAENFDLLLQEFHERFDPVDGVEMGMLEEMAACYWRQRRGWAMETRILNDAMPPRDGENDGLGRITAGFTAVCEQPNYKLLQRYDARLHRMFQRALDNLLRLRAIPGKAPLPNEPNPDSGHSHVVDHPALPPVCDAPPAAATPDVPVAPSPALPSDAAGSAPESAEPDRRDIPVRPRPFMGGSCQLFTAADELLLSPPSHPLAPEHDPPSPSGS